MGVLNLVITSARPTTYLTSEFETVTSKYAIVNRITKYLMGLSTGTESAESSTAPASIAISVLGNQTKASATLTCVSAIANDTVVINLVTFTCKNSGAVANEFNKGSTNTECATNLAAAINASVTALVTGVISATSSSNVVTIKAIAAGLQGNQNTVTTTGGTIAASSAKLAGGAVDVTAQTLSF